MLFDLYLNYPLLESCNLRKPSYQLSFFYKLNAYVDHKFFSVFRLQSRLNLPREVTGLFPRVETETMQRFHPTALDLSSYDCIDPHMTENLDYKCGI